MHVFIPIHFNAPLGGLQMHVVAQVRAILSAGGRATVMGPPGPFGDMIRAEGADMLESTGTNPVADAEHVLSQIARPIDLVHAHPFYARKVGLEVARSTGVPFILTMHSLYTDHLDRYGHDVDVVVAVSNAIRDRLHAKTGFPPERIVVIPNGVDTSLFSPSPRIPSNDVRRVFVATRLDRDKAVILNALTDTWARQADSMNFDTEWAIAGDGTERSAMEALASRLDEAAGRQLVSFVGWRTEDELAKLFASADLCIAPGRSALESMASARATIAIGSQGYVGLIDGSASLAGAYSNFGGLGELGKISAGESLFQDIDRVIYDDRELDRLGTIGRALVATFFDQQEIDAQMVRLHALVCACGPRTARPHNSWTADTLTGLTWVDADQRVTDVWVSTDAEGGLVVEATEAGAIRLHASLSGDGWVYLKAGPEPFDRALPSSDSWSIDPETRYALTCELGDIEGSPQLQLWWIEYDARGQRLQHASQEMVAGFNRLETDSHSQAASIRVALRVAGTGVATAYPLMLSHARLTVPEPPSSLRRRAADLESDYRGENLVFIIGPPRSGTTWVLKLLGGHPDVVAATEESLGIAVEERLTLETNIFNDNRPFTDAQIRHRFYRLSAQHPGKVIVEKTPIHVLFADRIREVFPDAAFVLVDRDGRDVVYSLVQVGRDPESWWKSAPDTVAGAARLWRRYASASLRVRRVHGPCEIRYEELHADPKGRFSRLLEQLGLDVDPVDVLVAAASDGQGIPIAGVFREGRVGGWESGFDADDIAAFVKEGGGLLIESGYVPDDSWTKVTPS